MIGGTPKKSSQLVHTEGGLCTTSSSGDGSGGRSVIVHSAIC